MGRLQRRLRVFRVQFSDKTDEAGSSLRSNLELGKRERGKGKRGGRTSIISGQLAWHSSGSILMDKTKDQEIAQNIIAILGRTNTPIYAGSELQLAVDINQWLARIAEGQVVITEQDEQPC